MIFTKQSIVVAAALFLVLGSGFLFLITSTDADVPLNSNGANTEEKLFNAQPTAEMSFVATITGELEEQTISATMESDGGGKARFVSNHDDRELQLITTPDASYSCDDGECVRFETTAASPLFNPNDYIYTEEEIRGFDNTTTYLGKMSCPAGSCDVWEVSNDNEELSRIYVGNDDNLISQVTGSSPSGNFTIVYDYVDVKIDIPENVVSD